MKTRTGQMLALVCLLCSVVLTGCVSPFNTREQLPLSALEIRALQTRTYEGIAGTETLKAVMHVLQDEGFQVNFGDAELGLLHATVTSAGYFKNGDFSGFGWNGTPPSTIEATVTVEANANGSKVRISFQQNSSTPNGWGFATPILDPNFYQDFFAKVERSVFIKKQGL